MRAGPAGRTLLAAVVAGALLTGACRSQEPADSTPDLRGATREPSPVPLGSVADIVDEVLPSVVNVRVKSLQQDPFGGVQEAAGQGSGVVIDEAGLVVTNNHVVRCAVEVEVVLVDGRKLEGTVVGTEPSRDLAVVEVEEEGLDPIAVGRSASLRLGDGVVALGFPLGLGGPTVTQGIVSGEGRSIQPQGGPALEGLLQTDAAINPGNSGGALVDAEGRLVGINTAAAGAGAAENIGFAIPVDAAIPVVEDIVSGERAWLGVQVVSVDSASVATQVGVAPEVRGAAIASVLAGPAADAGFRRGDVIVRIGDDRISSADDLTEVLAGLSPGDEVTIEVIGPAGPRARGVELDERPPEAELNRELCS